MAFGNFWNQFAHQPVTFGIIFFLAGAGLLFGIWFIASSIQTQSSSGTQSMPKMIGSWLAARFWTVFIPALIPLCLVILAKEALDQVPGWQKTPPMTQLVVFASLSLLMMMVFVPPILTKFWDTLKVTDSSPNADLLSIAKRLNLHLSGIEVWRTGRRLANAAAVGTLPFIRKILVTDLIVHSMTKLQLKGIFLHEAGHIKHGHNLWRMVSILLPLFLGLGVLRTLGVSENLLVNWSYVPDTNGLLGGVLLLLFTMALFSVLSHHLEFEADRYAVSMLIKLGNETQEKSIDSDSLSHKSQMRKRMIISEYCESLKKTVELAGGDYNHNSIAHPSAMKRIVKLRTYFLGVAKDQRSDRDFLLKFKFCLVMAFLASIAMLVG